MLQGASCGCSTHHREPTRGVVAGVTGRLRVTDRHTHKPGAPPLTCGTVWNRLLVCDSCCACAVRADSQVGSPWPNALTAMPGVGGWWGVGGWAQHNMAWQESHWCTVRLLDTVSCGCCLVPCCWRLPKTHRSPPPPPPRFNIPTQLWCWLTCVSASPAPPHTTTTTPPPQKTIPSPAAMSRYSLPAMSYSLLPWPLTNTTSAGRPYVCSTYCASSATTLAVASAVGAEAGGAVAAAADTRRQQRLLRPAGCTAGAAGLCLAAPGTVVLCADSNILLLSGLCCAG